MQCPECENHFFRDLIEDECIEPNEKFDCPSCSVVLRYILDEGTYYGAQHKTVEVVGN
ncbi:hypothetical protein [Vibrio cyclitrophicus]|uniref:hypothetical protein n=1 Tax=Vibrio cyclitrophicus TaxID=47951 RepID=UPI0003141C0B|nr:hypothetical protein [Vibrio cyclitrophicus]ERM61437.1 hypothetical protein M565_ctg1P1629 [Vibrio cyclitrophicus FF75]